MNSKNVYTTKWMNIRADDVEFPDGTQGVYSVVDKPDFALIIPFQDGKVTLVKQYRYAVEGSYWEFPQGNYEDKPTLDALQLAKDELREETGLRADSMQEIGYLYEAYGFSSQGFHIFLATKLTEGEQELQVSEQGMEVGTFSLEEFEQMVESGEIRDAPSVSAYGIAKMKGLL